MDKMMELVLEGRVVFENENGRSYARFEFKTPAGLCQASIMLVPEVVESLKSIIHPAVLSEDNVRVILQDKKQAFVEIINTIPPPTWKDTL